MRFVILFLLAVAASAHAQSDIEISCAGSPESAMLTVPKPADKFLHVICSKYGHVLTPTAGWFWTAPGTFEPRFYPAQMVKRDPKAVGNTIYFSSIEVTELHGETLQEKWSLLAELFPDEEPPTKVLQITAKNNSEGRHTIYIFPNSWGYSCSPSCKKSAVFLMVNQAKELPAW